MSLQDKHTTNHFNFIRLFAAFLVFYGHSYVLTGSVAHTFFNHEVGIYIFFAISGYLISKSWHNDPSLKRFFIRRSLRIFPALAVVILLSILLLGPLMTTLSTEQYFHSPHIYNYLTNIFLYITFYLPGLFEHNPVPNAVNGSLWSLPAEFFMYIVVAFIGKIKNSAKYITLALFISFVLISLLWAKSPTSQPLVIYATDLRQVIITGAYFWAGSLMYHWNFKRFFNFENFTIALIVLVFSYQFPHIYGYISIFIIPFLVLSFGLSSSNSLSIFNKFDYSYGFYIYAFPIQQSVAYLFPSIHIAIYLLSTFTITMLLSALSWHLIESPMLRLKPKRTL